MSAASQLNLYRERQTIQEAFVAFDAEHPEVRQELIRMALELQDSGFDHYGIKALMEVVRWHRHVEYGPEDEWKCNNSYSSRYARAIMTEVPALAGFFETRELKSE